MNYRVFSQNPFYKSTTVKVSLYIPLPLNALPDILYGVEIFTGHGINGPEIYHNGMYSIFLGPAVDGRIIPRSMDFSIRPPSLAFEFKIKGILF